MYIRVNNKFVHVFHDTQDYCLVSTIHNVVRIMSLILYLWVPSHHIYPYLISEAVEAIVYLLKSRLEICGNYPNFLPHDPTELHAKYDGDRSKSVTCIR